MPTCSREPDQKGATIMRFIGLDVHRDFCAIAIIENGHVRFAAKVVTNPDQLEILAASLRHDDQVALEATSTTLPIARILEPHVARVGLRPSVTWKRSLAPRRRPIGSTHEHLLGFCRPDCSREAGFLTKRAGRSGDGCPGVRSSPAHAPGPRTRSTQS